MDDYQVKLGLFMFAGLHHTGGALEAWWEATQRIFPAPADCILLEHPDNSLALEVYRQLCAAHGIERLF